MSAKETVGSPAVTYPVSADQLPPLELPDNRYDVRFARTVADLEEIQRLRFEVFNVELGEGLEASFATGRDEDRFDPICHHLMIVERKTGTVIGTYRMQTSEMAKANRGFYSADEFDLGGLPAQVVDDAVEVGRACIAVDHRNRRALFLLWKGLAAYLAHNRKRFLFGCCSLTSQDPSEGLRVMDYLVDSGHVHPEVSVRPQPGWACYDDSTTYDRKKKAHVPKLFRLYLRYGAKVTGPPAIDRAFQTIDYLVLFDLKRLDSDLHKLYFD